MHVYVRVHNMYGVATLLVLCACAHSASPYVSIGKFLIFRKVTKLPDYEPS